MERFLLFGAGKIGRSFIGQLFSRGGYEVIFVDIDEKIISALNKQHSYPVVIKSETGDEIIRVRNVRGLLIRQQEEIHELLSSVSFTATAVGPSNLPDVIALMAEGIKKRINSGNRQPLDIIIAENLRDAADYFEKSLEKYLDKDLVQNKIGLIETSIGKMVPIMTREDTADNILKVYAEPYNTLILDRKGFKNPMPDIKGLAPKDNMKAWVDRKAFIHNLGHAATAYYGHLMHPEASYLYEVLEDDRVKGFARETMQQSARILMAKHPGEFTKEGLDEHIEDLLSRFSNRALGDTVFRVGLDLYRKLGPSDRLAGAIRAALEAHRPYDKILYALICGFYFRSKDAQGNLYPSDEKFAGTFEMDGLEKTLQKVCKLNKIEHPEIYLKAKEINQEIVRQFNPLKR